MGDGSPSAAYTEVEIVITVLAENKNDRNIRAVIDFPALDGQLQKFCEKLDTVSDGEIRVRYAGTGDIWAVDTLLLENNINRNSVKVEELNLLSYILERMDENQITEYAEAMCEYTNDLGTPGVKSIINEAYDVHARAAGCHESLSYFDGENAADLIKAERILIKPYPQIDAGVFWQMIADAREKSGGDYDGMEQHLTETLSRMSPQDITVYKDIHDEYIRLADTDALYEAGSTLNKGKFRGDHFLDFRGWLLSQGKEMYMRVVNSPETLAELDLKPRNGSYEWEGFHYIAPDAYKLNTGDNFYRQPRILTPEQKNEIISEVKCFVVEDHQQWGQSASEESSQDLSL